MLPSLGERPDTLLLTRGRAGVARGLDIEAYPLAFLKSARATGLDLGADTLAWLVTGVGAADDEEDDTASRSSRWRVTCAVCFDTCLSSG